MDEGLSFTAVQQQRIDNCLNALLSRTRAHSVLLADATGQLIGKAGITNGRKATALSTLSAGSFAATSEMATFLGRTSHFSQSFHEGEDYGIYSATVNPSLLLTVTFDAEAKLGLVRIFTKRTVEELERITAEAQEHQDQGEEVDEMMDSEFGQLLADELDSLFAE
jgi:predicted regulator of Ras-like GTPase activity (Roadblock/LC7/MglB family)